MSVELPETVYVHQMVRNRDGMTQYENPPWQAYDTPKAAQTSGKKSDKIIAYRRLSDVNENLEMYEKRIITLVEEKNTLQYRNDELGKYFSIAYTIIALLIGVAIVLAILAAA